MKIFMPTLPNRIFFTGVPGSRWSAIAQIVETLPGMNLTDRTPARNYLHTEFSGHMGAYFGGGMEYPSHLGSNLDLPWLDPAAGTKLIKSHDWAHRLDTIYQVFNDDWIMLVYRPDFASYNWWHEAGGFKITYPSYAVYKNSANMMAEIIQQNAALLEFAYSKNATWSYFTPEWVKTVFGQLLTQRIPEFKDTLVTIIKQ